MSENSNDVQEQDLVQQLAEVNHELDNLSPYMEPGDYLKRSEMLNARRKHLEKSLNSKRSGESVSVTYNQDTDVDPFFKDYDVSIELQTKDPNKKKKAFKMLSAFSILFVIIAILVVVSWILGNISSVKVDTKVPAYIDPSGTYHGETTTENNIQPMGILDIFVSAFQGFKNQIDVIVFVLTIGAFITVVMASKSLNGFAQGVTRRLKGKEIYMLIPLMIFFSVCGTVEGFAEESLGFYLFLIPIMIMCGFDVFTGVLAILLGAGVGVLTSVVNPFLVSVAVNNINVGIGADIVGKASMGDGIIWRVITWIVFTAVAIAIVMTYAKRVKNNPSKSITFDTYEGDKEFFLGENVENVEMNWRRKLTLAVFFFIFIVMIVYLIGWDSLLGHADLADPDWKQAYDQYVYGKTITTPDAIQKEVLKHYNPDTWGPLMNAGNSVNDKAPYLTYLIPGLGIGSLIVPASFFLIAAIVTGIINGLGEKDFIKLFIDGAADMLSVCLIIGVAGGVTVILKKSYLQDLFVQGLGKINNIGSDIGKIIIFFLIFIPLSFLIPSSTGFATAIFPLLAGVVTKGNQLDYVSTTGMIQAFSFAAGLVNLVSPTSGVVMGAVGLARMGYKTFLKGMAPILGIFFVLSIVFLAIGGVLPTNSIRAL